MRQKVVPRANREAIAGFIRPPLQLGLVKPGTDFRHEVLVLDAIAEGEAPLVSGLSETDQCSVDSTARKLLKFITNS